MATLKNTTINDTGFVTLPVGNTVQRPASPTVGMMRYNSLTGSAEVYSSSGWAIFGAPPPTISTVTPGTYNGESGTSFTINGANFTNDAIVKFIDVNNTEYNATLVTFVNSTQLLATTPQDFTIAQGPLDVKVSQASGTVTKLDCIDTGGSPGWVTAAGQIGGTIYRNGSVSVTVSATDPDSGATVTYSVYSGSLPTGLSLNTSTGAITGTAPNVGSDTTYNFTLRATDNAGNTSDRAFSMVILQGAPGAPTIGIATSTGTSTATVTFTAPANTGGSTITSYTAVSSPSSITGTLSQSGSGTITVSGLSAGTSYTFTVYATNSYGNSASSSASNSITTTQAAPSSVEYLVVGGGGSGGGGSGRGGGGGGAGGLVTSTVAVSASTAYTVTVGAGASGVGPDAAGTVGSSSVFAGATGNGGGGGGYDQTKPPSSGGCGGGGSQNGNQGGAGGNQGYGGGTGYDGGYGGPWTGAGGGGMGGSGNSASSGGAGSGGSGVSYSITGSSVTYAGGGGGGSQSAPSGSGGSGIGGSGGRDAGGSGGAGNTGSGGGGAGWERNSSGNGGSGVVIIAYPNTYRALASIGAGLSYDQPSRSGYRVYRFTGGTGTISW